MAITFPTTLDTLTNSVPTQTLAAAGGVGVSDMLSNLNDAVEAIEAKVGINSSAVTTSIDYLLRHLPVQEATVDLNGNKLILDADADTSVTADTDDQIDIEIAGADDFRFVANVFRALSGSSLETNTINETTAASGVTIDGLLIKDSKLATNDSVVTANITNANVTLAKLASEAWTDSDPTWSTGGVAPAIGDGTIQGRYVKIGRTVVFNFKVSFGSTSTFGSGDFRFSLPFTAVNTGTVYQHVGTVLGFDSSTSTRYIGVAEIGDGGTVTTLTFHSTTGNASASVPITWAQNDQIIVNITYEAAS